MLEKINRRKSRFVLLFIAKLITGALLLIQCSHSQNKDNDFKLYLDMFRVHELPFKFYNLDSLYYYSDTIKIDVGRGWEYVKSEYPSLSREQSKFLPSESAIELDMYFTYQAIYQFKTSNDFKIVLFFKELDAANEHEEGLGKHLILVTYKNDGDIIDFLPLAFSVYNIKDQIGSIDNQFRVKIKGDYYLYDQSKTQTLEQEFETTSLGKFKLIKSDTTMRELR